MMMKLFYWASLDQERIPSSIKKKNTPLHFIHSEFHDEIIYYFLLLFFILIQES